MTDPEEQLRRLAEGRAEMVEPFSTDEIERDAEPRRPEPRVAAGNGAERTGAEVIEFSPRRWPTAVAASLLAIVAVGATAFAIFGGPDDRPESAGLGTVETTVAPSDTAPPTTVDQLPSTTTSLTPEVSIPDVVGEDIDDAEAALEEAGIEVERGTQYVDGDDPRLDTVVEVISSEATTSAGHYVEIVVARLAPSLLSTDPCARPPHLLGAFDDDLLVDRVYPRFADGRITEIEVCTGTGVRVVARGLDLHRIELVDDVDGDGIDEIVASVGLGGTESRVLELAGEELLVTSSTLPVVVDTNPNDPCFVSDLDVALIGDVDGDGVTDIVSPREGFACLRGTDTVVPLGDMAGEAGTWFLDDIDDDGVLEVFIGQTTADTIDVRPYSIAADGTITAAAEEDCCVQTTPAAAAVDVDVPGRWFSCLAESFGREPELVSGRFWIDLEVGAVDWTVDVGSAASADLVNRMTFDDPLATDAWIPGNGCRNSSGAWMEPATIEFGDDGLASATSLEAFNSSVALDDPARRLVRLREALGMSARFDEASGPYRENLDEGFFELHGLHDDSVAATRWTFGFSEEDGSLLSVTRSWACQPDRGHDDFSTELCV